MTSDRITPLHLPRCPEKLASLIESMEQDGWVGNPVLILTEDTNEYQAVTGSHRIEAAIQVGIEIPYYPLELDEEILVEIYEARNDEDRLELIVKNGGDEESIRIMSEEVENNI